MTLVITVSFILRHTRRQKILFLIKRGFYHEETIKKKREKEKGQEVWVNMRILNNCWGSSKQVHPMLMTMTENL